jgi:7-cyano-7-deazaguanine synthase in queuosine biosynthesis
MNSTMEYNFDFSTPGHIQWSSGTQKQEFVMPEHPVRFVINDESIAREFSTVVEPVLADALDVGVAAHMADRLALRERFVGKTRTPVHRSFEIAIAVREPEIWNDDLIKSDLQEALSFLTQDSWQFSFVKREVGRKADSQQHLFGRYVPTNVDVGLFSGGLDSYAGTAIQFDQHPERHFVCVSGSPNNIQKGLQRRQFQYLCSRFGRLGTHVSVQYSMAGAAEMLQEPTRRTRAFVFLLLGAVVALTAESDSVHVYENGIGAINLPFDLSQVGIDNTRAMHPRTLRNIAALVSRLRGKPFLIENRSIFLTKAEMCQEKSVRHAAEGIANTFSCDGLTRKGEHCGFCTSCLLRRLALEGAHLSSFDHGNYLNDCLSADWHPNRRQLRGLASMTWQASRLRPYVSEGAEWKRLVIEFPELQLVLAELASGNTAQGLQENLRRLYRKHVSEWFDFGALKNLPTRIAA